MNKEDILQVIRNLGLRLEWHSYRAVPSGHRFAVWNIPNKNFDGADEMAFQRHFPLTVTFFYREKKDEKDFLLESQFENAVRAVGTFSCSSDYDEQNDLFYTQYNFNLSEFMEE